MTSIAGGWVGFGARRNVAEFCDGVFELSSAQRGWLAGPYFVFNILVGGLVRGLKPPPPSDGALRRCSIAPTGLRSFLGPIPGFRPPRRTPSWANILRSLRELLVYGSGVAGAKARSFFVTLVMSGMNPRPTSRPPPKAISCGNLVVFLLAA